MTSIGAASYSYPWSQKVGDLDLTYRRMQAGDRGAVLAFTDALSEHDLLFVRIDISQPEGVDEWIRNVERGRTHTILAICDERIVGYGSLHYNDINWTRHLGEIRLMVAPSHRSLGIGRSLADQVFAIAQEIGLLKVTARMMSSQRNAQDLFHRLDFVPEALLHDWVIDRSGRTHDLILMSRELDES